MIYLSALTDTKDKVKAFKQGGVDYIEKPFKFEEVQARVDTHLKLHYFQRELEAHNNNLKRLQIFCRLIAEKLSLNPQYKDKINANFIDILQKTSSILH